MNAVKTLTMKQMTDTRPLHRLSSDDYFVAKQVLSVTASIGMPDEQTQRQAFKKLIPIIYVMRKKTGITFKQITAMFNQCGFTLSNSTIRSYYSQFVPFLQKECEAMMQELALPVDASTNDFK